MQSGRYRFIIGISSLALLVGLAACEPNSFAPTGLSTITVIVRDNMAYPIFQFRCSEAEGPGENDSCPDGFECDGQHYHGTVSSIGRITPTGASDVDFRVISAADPDSCHCGWGKVGEAEVRNVSVFVSDVDSFVDIALEGSFPSVEGLTTAQAFSSDPCGG